MNTNRQTAAKIKAAEQNISRLMADDRSSMDDIDRAERILEDLVAEAHYNSPEGRAYRAAK